MSTVSREAFEKQDAFGIGAPNDAYAQYFTGQSYLKPLTARGACPVFLANVTFEPGCRNNWHIHHASRGGGQLLICPAWLSPSRRRSSTGTERRRTAGSATSPSRFPARTPGMNGASRSRMRNTQASADRRHDGLGCFII